MSQYSDAYSWGVWTAIHEIIKENPGIKPEEIANMFPERIKSRAEYLSLWRMSKEVYRDMTLMKWRRERKRKSD